MFPSVRFLIAVFLTAIALSPLGFGMVAAYLVAREPLSRPPGGALMQTAMAPAPEQRAGDAPVGGPFVARVPLDEPSMARSFAREPQHSLQEPAVPTPGAIEDVALRQQTPVAAQPPETPAEDAATGNTGKIAALPPEPPAAEPAPRLEPEPVVAAPREIIPDQPVAAERSEQTLAAIAPSEPAAASPAASVDVPAPAAEDVKAPSAEPPPADVTASISPASRGRAGDDEPAPPSNTDEAARSSDEVRSDDVARAEETSKDPEPAIVVARASSETPEDAMPARPVIVGRVPLPTRRPAVEAISAWRAQLARTRKARARPAIARRAAAPAATATAPTAPFNLFSAPRGSVP